MSEKLKITGDEARAIVRAAHPGGSDHPTGIDYVRTTVEYLNRRELESASQPGGEPAAYIRADHLAKARVAPYLCRVEPTLRDGMGMVPIYAGSQPGGGEAEDIIERFKNPMTPYGMLIRALRIVAGTTLMDMANHAGITPAHLSAIETGRKPLFHEDVVAASGYFHGLGIPGTLIVLERAYSVSKNASVATPSAEGVSIAGLLKHEPTPASSGAVARRDVDELVSPAAVRANEVDPEVINAGLDGVKGNLDTAADTEPHGRSRSVEAGFQDRTHSADVQACVLFTVEKRGALVEFAPTVAAFDLPDGSHQLGLVGANTPRFASAILAGAELIEQEATAVADCHTIGGEWQEDDLGSKVAHDDMLAKAAALRALLPTTRS